MQVVESHRLMSHSSIAQGAVDGVSVLQIVKFSRMECQGVDDFGGVQEDAVEGIGIVGDEGGIDGLGQGGGRLFRGNRILNGFLRKAYYAKNQ